MHEPLREAGDDQYPGPPTLRVQDRRPQRIPRGHRQEAWVPCRESGTGQGGVWGWWELSVHLLPPPQEVSCAHCLFLGMIRTTCHPQAGPPSSWCPCHGVKSEEGSLGEREGGLVVGTETWGCSGLPPLAVEGGRSTGLWERTVRGLRGYLLLLKLTSLLPLEGQEHWGEHHWCGSQLELRGSYWTLCYLVGVTTGASVSASTRWSTRDVAPPPSLLSGLPTSSSPQHGSPWQEEGSHLLPCWTGRPQGLGQCIPIRAPVGRWEALASTRTK